MLNNRENGPARRWLHRLYRPDPVPHPDDIILDARRMTFRIAGPLTREELPRYQTAAELIEAYREANAALLEQASAMDDGPRRDQLHRTIDTNNRHIAKLIPHYGPQEERRKDPVVREVEELVGQPLDLQELDDN